MKLKLIISILLVSISNNCLSNNDFDKKIIVDISEQKLYLHNYAKKEVKIYPVSTSKYGIGSEANSYKTPLGLHRIENKIGHGAERNTIFKARRNTGRKAIINTPGSGDSITSRIMWLKGLELGKNSGEGIDSYRRYIYIHGTREENKIGQVASHGCIRMYNKDVIELFDRVDEGIIVEIKP
ncbi:L,D-transpeptidase [Candidatus Marithrix sp. Canyon 246]|uniref:L,D-transpeptidase n=1 Tax=Candidatus Marithrix sp. Canyon 246 TaxID=1827136 RepID=UPI00084A1D78|nr:L,D-transpeptidase [Candidatus Marithrix sp. Canyon 246]